VFVRVRAAGSIATIPTLFMAAWMDVLMNSRLSLARLLVYLSLCACYFSGAVRLFIADQLDFRSLFGRGKLASCDKNYCWFIIQHYVFDPISCNL